ncbi:hypothetical protein, partial [Falsiroseomonas oryzae]|uniref:hypothetical protein n=1 Tax=Falsiroseomonas oryzae TaxID=2766473 RepID=UPI0038CC1C62
MTEPPPATPAELRAQLAALPAEARPEAIRELMRREAAAGPPSSLVLSLIVSHTALFLDACRTLEEAPDCRFYALTARARLHNRREEFGALRSVLLDTIAEHPEEQEPRRELLRTEILAPSPTAAEREQAWRLAAPALPPLAAASATLQLQVAHGERPRIAPFLAMLGR